MSTVQNSFVIFVSVVYTALVSPLWNESEGQNSGSRRSVGRTKVK